MTVKDASGNVRIPQPSGNSGDLPDGFFRHAFHAYPDSISVTRLSDGTFLDVSQGFERITEYSRAEAVGRTAVELGFYDEVPGGRTAVYDRLRREGYVRDLRITLRTRSGNVRYLRVSLDRIELEGEVCSLTVARDITEQVRAENDARQGAVLMRNIIDASPNSVFVKDRDGYYITVNRAMAARNGLTPEDMIGMRDIDIGANWFESDGDIERHRQSERRVIDSRVPLQIPEEEFVFRDGRRAWFQTVKVPLSINGSPDCLLGIAVDITERRGIEQQLRESEERFRLLFEHAGLGIVNWTLDGRLISLNQRAKDDIGGRESDLTGLLCTEIFPGELGARILARIKRAESSSEAQTYESHAVTGNQSRWFLVTYAVVRRPNGTVVSVQTIAQDITASRVAQAEIQNKTSLLQEAERLANVGSWEWNTGTQDIYWSPQLYTIYGRDPHLGPPDDDSWWDCVYCDDRDRVRHQLSEAVRNEGTHNSTFRIVRENDKEVRHVHTRGRVTKNDGGDGCTVVAVTQDITQHVLAEEGLRESESKLQALADAAFDAIFLSDKGICLDQNLTAEKMFGYSREEAIGRPGTDWIAPEHRDTVMQNMRRGHEDKYEVTALRKDGSTFPCAIKARMVEFKGHRIRYTALTDITEQKQSEEALNQSRAFADNLIQTASVMIVGLNLEGRVTLFNPAGEVITGYSHDELVGKNWFQLVVPTEQRAQLAKLFKALPRGGMSKLYENSIRTKSGEERIIAWSNSEIVVDGTIIGSISFGIDITERRRAEEQLIQLNRRLAAEQEALLDKNIALKEVLDHMDEEKREYKHQICDSIGKMLTPIVDELEKNGGHLSQRKMAIVKDGLDAILRKDVDVFAGNVQKLSPRELDICDLIRKGLTSKGIAAELGISAQTVHKHRQLVRKKLQINNKAVNLASYLRSRA